MFYKKFRWAGCNSDSAVFPDGLSRVQRRRGEQYSTSSNIYPNVRSNTYSNVCSNTYPNVYSDTDARL